MVCDGQQRYSTTSQHTNIKMPVSFTSVCRNVLHGNVLEDTVWPMPSCLWRDTASLELAGNCSDARTERGRRSVRQKWAACTVVLLNQPASYLGDSISIVNQNNHSQWYKTSVYTECVSEAWGKKALVTTADWASATVRNIHCALKSPHFYFWMRRNWSIIDWF